MRDNRTIGEKISDGVAHFGGSWKFIIIFCLFLLIWVSINMMELFQVIQFDKPPFILLNLILSFIAAFQAPFIMMSQNRAEKKQDEANRKVLGEIKELVEQDIAIELEIKSLNEEIKLQQAQLITALQLAIALGKLNEPHCEIIPGFDPCEN